MNKFDYFGNSIMENLRKRVDEIIKSNLSTNEILLRICKTLSDEISYYNWVGFYFKNGDKDELKLGPYIGAMTSHVIIPYGKGICGQVAESNETFIVPDVSLQDNYLACSIQTKAEIVVPILKNGKNIGQIDVDSHITDPFTEEDEKLLNYICNCISKIV